MSSTTRREFLATGCLFVAGTTFGKPIRGCIGANPHSVKGVGVRGAADYVQDGLVAMYDGIENVAYGVHDFEASYWKNLVDGSPFSDGERTGGGLSVNPPIWTDKSCRSPEVYTGNTRKACFNVTASLEASLAVACGETVARTYGDTGVVQGWNASAIMGCDVRLSWNYKNENRVLPAATFAYSSTQYQVWSCHSGDTTIDPEIARSYHVRRDGTSRLGIRVNGGAESVSGWGNGQTLGISNVWPLVVANQTAVEVLCIRYYSRALTADEIAYNYQIDKERFGI